MGASPPTPPPCPCERRVWGMNQVLRFTALPDFVKAVEAANTLGLGFVAEGDLYVHEETGEETDFVYRWKLLIREPSKEPIEQESDEEDDFPERDIDIISKGDRISATSHS